MTNGRLKTYRGKRDFSKTIEPKGSEAQQRSTKPLFVVQKHSASTLHYDFRLEIDGVLKSWSVPKGPSLDPRKRRLAIETEDHPLEYADFEGIIPEPEYGAGSVIIWDKGTFENESREKGKPISLHDAYEKGEIKFRLNGQRLKGSFVLLKTGGPKNNQWLLMKRKDEYADPNWDINAFESSVVSGKTLETIAYDGR